MSGSCRRPFRMSWSGQETLPDVREWSGCPPGCPGVVGRPSRKFRSPSRMSESGLVTLPDV